MQATRGAVVSFNYTLSDDDGKMLDSSEGCPPLSYVHGYDNIIPGLERELEGAGVGFTSKVVVEPADAYGDINPEAIFEVGREMFPPDVDLLPGMQFVGETPSGGVPLSIKEIKEDTVVVDGNHPLAGLRLHFDVEIVDIRVATEKELEQGHVD